MDSYITDMLRLRIMFTQFFPSADCADMWKIWIIVLLAPYFFFVYPATIDRSGAISPGDFYHAPGVGTRNSSPGLVRRATKIATRQLPEHWDFMHIVYEVNIVFPAQLYRRTLFTALTRITTRVNADGDDAVLQAPFIHIYGNIVLHANHESHSASNDLTWGILEEAVTVLLAFTKLKTHPLLVRLYEGLDGRGPPIGEITVSMQGGLDSAHKGSIQVG